MRRCTRALLACLAGVLLVEAGAARALDQELLDRAKAGDVEAQIEVGRLYTTGKKGFPVNRVKGVLWFQRAADQGDPRGFLNLATAYEQGKGVDQDDAKAVELLYQAAALRHPRAMFMLAVRFEQGKGVAPNPVLAHLWMSRAARARSIGARFRFGPMAKRMLPEQIEASRAIDQRDQLDALRLDPETGEPVGPGVLPPLASGPSAARVR